MMWKDLPTPCYVVDEGKIRKNLEILANLEQECGCHTARLLRKHFPCTACIR